MDEKDARGYINNLNNPECSRIGNLLLDYGYNLVGLNGLDSGEECFPIVRVTHTGLSERANAVGLFHANDPSMLTVNYLTDLHEQVRDARCLKAILNEHNINFSAEMVNRDRLKELIGTLGSS